MSRAGRQLALIEERTCPEPNTGCWLWTAAANRQGYGRCSPSRYGEELAHRVSYRLHIGHIPRGLCVLHRCDTPACVNPGHLFLGTRKDNNLDMAAKGRTRPRRGESSWSSKLTESQVSAIRADGRSQRAIARDYGLTQGQVSRIKSGGAWAHSRPRAA